MSSYSTVSSAPPKRRAGRTKFRETRHPVFKGVRRRGKNGGRWVCEVRDPNDNKSRIWLGTYATPEMAARAHDVAALALRGRKACLNFADSASRLAKFVPSSPSTSKDIQMAAAKAAEAFRPLSTTAGQDDAPTLPLSVLSSTLFDQFCDTMDMVDYYVNMAEGLMVEPPPQYYWDDSDDGGEDHVPLWSYSI